MKRVFVIILAAAFSYTAMAQDKTVNKTYQGVKSIRLTTSGGDGIIKRSNNDEVSVSLRYSYAQEDYEFTMEQDGDRLRLKEEFLKPGYRAKGSSTWTLEIPDGMDLNFHTGSGNFEVTGLEVDIRSNFGSGDIMLSKVKGDFRANTGSGRVRIEQSNGNFSINTGSGDMDLTEVEGEIDLNAGSGDIDISEGKGYFSINTGSGSIMGRSIILTESSDFNSGSGNTRITLSEPLKNSISLDAGSGDAVLDFKGNTISGEIVMETDKRRGRIIAPFEFDSEEEIEKFRSTVVRKTVKIGDKNIRISIRTGSGTAEIRQ